MGRFARIILVIASAVLSALMIFIAPLTDAAIFFYGFAAFCILFSIFFCFTHGNFAQFLLSSMGLFVFCAGLFYLGHEITGSKSFSINRSEPSIFNACMFMLVFGLPSGKYAFNTRFGLRRDAA